MNLNVTQKLASQRGTHGNVPMVSPSTPAGPGAAGRGSEDQSSRWKPASMANLHVPRSLSPAQSAPPVLQVFGSQNPLDVRKSAHVAAFLMVLYMRDKRLEPV